MQRHVRAVLLSLLVAGCAGQEARDPVETGDRVAELQREALELSDARRHSEAIDKLLEAARLAPDDADVQRMLGGTYGLADDYTSAVQALEKARDLDPGDPRTRAMLGMAYGRVRRFDLAEVELREVLRIAPDDLEAHVWIGMIGYESKNFPLCAEGFGRYVELVEARDQTLVTEREKRRLREVAERARYCRSGVATPANP